MSRCKTLLGALTVVSIVSLAVAQEPPRSSLDAPGPRFSNSIELLRIEKVRQELALSDEQMKQLEEAFEPLNALAGDQREAQGLSPDARRKRFEENSKKGGETSKVVEEKVQRILQPEQLKRFKQLSLQSAGAMALLRPAVVKDLDLTQEQQEEIQTCMQPVRDHLRLASPRPEPGQPTLKDYSEAEREQWRADLHKLQENAQVDMLAVLSDEQRAKFAEMKGKEFEFPYGRGLGASVGSKPRQPAKK